MVLYDIFKYFNIILVISVERVFRNVNYRGWEQAQPARCLCVSVRLSCGAEPHDNSHLQSPKLLAAPAK